MNKRIEELRELRKTYPYDPYVDELWRVIDELTEVAVETKPEWVAVADYLPPEGLMVETKIHVPSWHPWGLIKRTYKAGTWLTSSGWKDALPLPTHWHEMTFMD